MKHIPHFIFPALLCSVSSFAYGEAVTNKTEESSTIEQITVEASPTANTLPVGTFDSPVSNLEYDPRVDLTIA